MCIKQASDQLKTKKGTGATGELHLSDADFYSHLKHAKGVLQMVERTRA